MAGFLYGLSDGDDEAGAVGVGGVEGDVAAEGTDEAAADGEAEAYAGHEVVALLEGVEDALAVFCPDAAAGVGDDEADAVAVVLAAEFDVADVGELDGVVHQVLQGALQAVGVGMEGAGVADGGGEAQLDSCLLPALALGDDGTGEAVDTDVCLLAVGYDGFALALGELEELVDDGGDLPSPDFVVGLMPSSRLSTLEQSIFSRREIRLLPRNFWIPIR